ncbi:hypothetical protein DSO57_1039766 [Entomophthora muscae]|uniref:Uncharacterized protein n=1 Tax=Entomophthora muscae TaxID=34485 RepID=A0ACC2TGV2_9FUNG|nr:hypothetical protein DSO57_1039766 [Entomophthora muscae]
MLHSVCIGFLNQLWASDSQFCKQDCATTVAGSEHSTAPNSSAGDFPDEDSIFEEPLHISSAPPSGNPSGAQHPFPQCLPLTGAPPPTPSAMLCACRNSNNVVINYPNLLIKFGICHHEVTMYSFVQALHSEEDAMTLIQAAELYHGRYNASRLAAEVRLGLQSATLALSEISAQHAYTIAIHNEYIDRWLRFGLLSLRQIPASTRP